VVQEVFLVVHRRLPEFQARSTARTWVYAIAVRVARNHRRTQHRRRLGTSAMDGSIEVALFPEAADRRPDALLAKAEAARLVNRLLNELEDDLLEVFVLSELEELTAHEIAEALAVNANTVSSRLRAARRAFDQALCRARARDEWRIR
jgi:RNA polymerase sigma-70 factor (ECF subfamily)